MKKSELVEMCRKHFGEEQRGSGESNRRGRSRTSRSSSASRKSSSDSRKGTKSAVASHTARRKSSIGTKGHKSPSITIIPNLGMRSPPGKKADDSEPLRFDRTPSPVAKSSKTFSGRPSLVGQSNSRKISIVPMSTLPPRRKSVAMKSELPPSTLSRIISRVSVLLAIAALSTTVLYILNASNAPRVPLCNTDGTAHVAKSLCSPCPKLGKCSNGYITTCPEHHVIRGDSCVRDEAKFVNAMAIVDTISTRMARLKGQKECGEDVSDSVYPEQLRLWLRMEFPSLSDEQYRAAFDLAINGEKEGIVMPKHVVVTQLGLIRSSFGVKSLGCRAKEVLSEWLWTLLILGISTLYFGLKLRSYIRKNRLTKSLVNSIEENTLYREGHMQGLTVTDLRDKGMPLEHMDDRSARKQMNLILKSFPDIQSGEDMNRGGEMVFWSAQKLRAQQTPNNFKPSQ